MVNLTEMIEMRGTTARELAAKVGVTEATVSLYAAGKRTPRVDVAQRIALALGCDVRDVFPPSLGGNSNDRRPSSAG